MKTDLLNPKGHLFSFFFQLSLFKHIFGTKKVQVRLCSTPKKAAADIYEMLGYKKMPFWRKVKVCSTQ